MEIKPRILLNILTTNEDRTKKEHCLTCLAQGVVIILLNTSLLCFILFKKRLRRVHANKFLASLLLANVSMGSICVYVSISPSNLTKVEFERQKLDYSTSAILLLFCNLILVTSDRLFSIRFPFIYIRINLKVIVLSLSITWLIPLTFMPLTLLLGVVSDDVFIAQATTSMFFLALENIFLFVIVRKQIKHMMQTTVEINEKQLRWRALQKKKHKSFFLCFIIAITHICFWLPALLHSLLVNKVKIIPQNETFEKVAFYTLFGSCITDPCIYVLRNKKVKHSAVEFFSIMTKTRVSRGQYWSSGILYIENKQTKQKLNKV